MQTYWRKGSGWVDCSILLYTFDTKSAPEQWRNGDEDLNGSTFAISSAASLERLTLFVYFVASGGLGKKNAKQPVQNGFICRKKPAEGQTTFDHMYPNEQFRAYGLSGLLRAGNDSNPTAHHYHNTHRWQHQPLPTSYLSAVLLVH